MLLPLSTTLLLLPLPLSLALTTPPPTINTTTCNGKTYTYTSLAGYGFLPSTARDKFGDTIGGIGSAIALDKASWKRTSKSKGKGGKEAYEGVVYGLPDRGWNTEGTQNTQSRVHKFGVEFEPAGGDEEVGVKGGNVKLTYLDTVLLTGPDGGALTGLDPTGSVQYEGFPALSVAEYVGDGFGGNGTGGARVALDAEGLVLGEGGSYWISDEYAAYVYQFDRKGRMIRAVRSPDSFVPLRNGSESFSAASPPIYDQGAEISPEDPSTGRANNQGLEALTASPDGKYLYTMLQSATIQDGGSKSSTRRNTRLLKYRVKSKSVELEAEYAVQLPVLSTGKVAGQSEIHYISDTQFLVLARDSGAGHGQPLSESIYRNADVIDISNATNIKGKYDGFNEQIASSKGVLKSEIVPATYCPWLSYNNNAQLSRFGVRNGGAQDASLLNEKWESFALAPVDSEFQTKGEGKEYYLISFSDNDFITQDGYINFGKQRYRDASGYDLDSQVLVFKVRLPKGAKPL